MFTFVYSRVRRGGLALQRKPPPFLLTHAKNKLVLPAWSITAVRTATESFESESVRKVFALNGNESRDRSNRCDNCCK